MCVKLLNPFRHIVCVFHSNRHMMHTPSPWSFRWQIRPIDEMNLCCHTTLARLKDTHVMSIPFKCRYISIAKHFCQHPCRLVNPPYCPFTESETEDTEVRWHWTFAPRCPAPSFYKTETLTLMIFERKGRPS